jgi:hypothetical protein
VSDFLPDLSPALVTVPRVTARPKERMMQSDEPHDAAGGTTTTIARTLLAKGAAVTLVTLILAVAVTTTVATAQNYTDLYDFNNNGGPNDPHWNAIAQGRDGNMYSTTDQAFTGGRGDVFKITPTGTLTVLHNFKWTDGRANSHWRPHAGHRREVLRHDLWRGGFRVRDDLQATDRNLYGTNSEGASTPMACCTGRPPREAVPVSVNFTVSTWVLNHSLLSCPPPASLAGPLTSSVRVSQGPRRFPSMARLRPSRFRPTLI